MKPKWLGQIQQQHPEHPVLGDERGVRTLFLEAAHDQATRPARWRQTKTVSPDGTPRDAYTRLKDARISGLLT